MSQTSQFNFQHYFIYTELNKMSDDDIKFIIKKLTPETYDKFQKKKILKKIIKTPPSTPINIEVKESVPSSSGVPSSSSSSSVPSSSGWTVQPDQEIEPQLDKILLDKNVVMPLDEKMELLTNLEEGATKFLPPPCPPSDMASDDTDFPSIEVVVEQKEEAPVEVVEEPPVEEQKEEVVVEQKEEPPVSEGESEAVLNEKRLLVRWLYLMEYCEKKPTIPFIHHFSSTYKSMIIEEQSGNCNSQYSLEYDFLSMPSTYKLKLGYNKFIAQERKLCGNGDKVSVKKWEVGIRERILDYASVYSKFTISELEGKIEKITDKYDM
jgi:hypothetical protein